MEHQDPTESTLLKVEDQSPSTTTVDLPPPVPVVDQPSSLPVIDQPSSLPVVDLIPEDAPEDIKKCLKVYNFVLDLKSLRAIADGYSIYTRAEWPMEEFVRIIIKGVHGAIIGDFKVGKTFITGKLLDIETPSDQILQTPGICVAAKNFNSQAKKVEVKSTAAMNPRAKLRAKKGATNAVKSTPTAQPTQAANAAASSQYGIKEYELILYDTAGTDMPAHSKSD